MFRIAELGRKVSKDEFEALAPDLRVDLVQVQQDLRQTDFPVIVVFAGVDGAGKSESMNLLNEWMDPRWILNSAYGPPSDEERERPEFWRYWRDLPPAGQIGLFLSSWYSRPVLDHVYGRITDLELDTRLNRVLAFEKKLADDGALIVKYWMHLSKKVQKQRFKQLEKDPNEAWRVTEQDWQNWENYDKFIRAAERTIMRTNVGHAPWYLVEGQDHRYRSLTVLTTLRDSIRLHMERRRALAQAEETVEEEVGNSLSAPVEPGLGAVPVRSVLDSLDMTLALEKKEYNEELPRQRAKLHTAFRAARERGISTVLVFEGWDAGGKGGTIRRLTAAVDARNYRVIPVAAPTDEERAHHYLWRFWRHLSRAGRMTVFDRSWYGRVLVERVEGFATTEEWQRAYAEINDFEGQLVEFGSVLCKFWMSITPEEQLRRFEARQETPYKRWKLTDEDWRNRDKWDLYERAVNDMVAQTSTSLAPWTLVEANDKRYGRVKVIKTVRKALEARIEAHDKALKEPEKGKDKTK